MVLWANPTPWFRYSNSSIAESGSGISPQAWRIRAFPVMVKGRDVVETRNFEKSEFVVDLGEAKERETKYSMDVDKGCYMYSF